MFTDEIDEYGKKFIPHFKGVYPLDKFPSHICIPSALIVNTDTHNLRGQHWIAISYENGGIVFAFDPLGIYYPRYLMEKLHRLPHQHVIYNTIMYQHPLETTCGLYCLAFLQHRATINTHIASQT